VGSRQGGIDNKVPALYPLGLNWETLSLVQYNPLWPVLYEAESKRITGNFSNGIEKLEHVGSTAVPGLGSKPIIDIICADDYFRHKLDLQKRYGHDRRNYREGKEQWFEENFPRNGRDGGL
jgi:GrpB-like predicted nucleotidyltransferase (UPF0157 family)